MIRRFRTVVQSKTEPEDKEVIWMYKSDLYYWEDGRWEILSSFTPDRIAYNNSEYPDINSIEDALDTLLYISPEISSFTLRQAGTYEKGTNITRQDISWSYNKSEIKSQEINGVKIPNNIRSIYLEENIDRNTTFTLKMTDNKNVEVTASASINFVDYIYYGVSSTGRNLESKISGTRRNLTVTVGTGEYIHLFIPNSLNIREIVNNGVESTSDFVATSETHTSDKGIDVEGVYYVSKNHSLNSVTLNFK